MSAGEHHDDLPKTVRAIRELLEDIVRRQIVADVPVCVLLSGGLDSTLIATLGQRHRRNAGVPGLMSFTVDFESPPHGLQAESTSGSSDLEFAHEVAQQIRTEHRSLILDARELADPAIAVAALKARDLPPLGDMDTLFFVVRSLYISSSSIVVVRLLVIYLR